MADGSDARIERQRIAAALGDLDRLPDCGDAGTAARLLTTTTLSTYPTAAASFYACNPTELDGAEVEGGAATPTADTATVVYALNQGTQVPPVGTVLIAHGVGGRWVFRYDG